MNHGEQERKEEKTIMKAHESPWRLIFWLKMIFTLGLYWFSWQSHYLELTEQRLIYRSGWLSRHEKSVALDKILDITVRRGILGRMFGYGDIALETAGGPFAEFVFHNASNPIALRDAIQKRA